MQKVAKLIIIDTEGQYLLLHRSNHPRFGYDPDLAGGTVEEGESSLDALIREVKEEIEVVVDPAHVEELYDGTHYSLYVTHFEHQPSITLSWEHSSYEWVSKKAFFHAARDAKDTYMNMVADIAEKRLV